MEHVSKEHLDEMVTTLSESWKGSLITAGLNAGIFSSMNYNTPVSIDFLAEKLNYDRNKLDKWFYYCAGVGLVNQIDGGYILSPKCHVFMPDSPYKDIVGFTRLNDYFMRSAVEAQHNFKKGSSLDKLTEGKITRNYQPSVSDNLSAELMEYFKQYNMGGDDTLLDVGCGIGAFARTILKNMPGLKITGLDPNLFAIEWGRKENREKGLGERLKMVVGDAVDDIGEFADKSFDWVIAVNLFHFFPVEHRLKLMKNMVRIASKGVFFTETILEKSKLALSADPLMSLLWNDYTGFFREHDAENLNNQLAQAYPDAKIVKHLILQNSTYLMAITK
ncbi:MAG TPA: class I SAM-dependent methyltransferase [Candidatus Goldiibacteriota bacterium]|nr:class I SAM-dependent methyltransferase [Candidatus Goldiibacteriota bacterium]HPN64731.1 class I SAM-dependent methyltransferase [Candidatus Goldiibacteriota bacterium]HRQ43206.1 class I SAM-dependent methyltransferase [Candidatus Goldiibacteriota bacterium]